MDNIIFSTMIGLVAAFITAVLGFTKLINDKEGKTSDFRQEWTGSIRQTLSELVSCFRYLIDLHERASTVAAICDKASAELGALEVSSSKYEAKKELLTHNTNKLEMIAQEIVNTRKDIHRNISLAQMHFKHNDFEFSSIENKIKLIMSILKNLRNESKTKKTKESIENVINTASNEIETLCIEMTFISRSILKSEWERIKKGEDVYQKTKKAFKTSSIIVAVMISTLFLAVFIAKYSNHLADKKISSYSESNNQKNICAPEQPPTTSDSKLASTKTHHCSTKSQDQPKP